MRSTEGHPVSGTRSPLALARTSVHKNRQHHPFAVYLSWIVLIILMLVSSCVSVSVQAPPSSYVVTAGALSTTTKTQFLIVDGVTLGPGASSSQAYATSIIQFIALDLTTAWNASQPVWSKVANSRDLVNGKISLHTGFLAISLDGQYLSTFGGLPDPTYIGIRYTFANGTWTAGPRMVEQLSVSDYRAAQDPETGLVYIAEVHENEADVLQMYCFDIIENALVSVASIPPAIVPVGTPSMYGDEKTYSVVYSTFRKSFLYLGGQTVNGSTGPSLFVLTEFVPTTNIWRRPVRSACGPFPFFFFVCACIMTDYLISHISFPQSVQGGGPSNRADHCMASSESSSPSR